MIILKDLILQCACDANIIIRHNNTNKCILTGTAYDVLNILSDDMHNNEIQTIYTDNSSIVICV